MEGNVIQLSMEDLAKLLSETVDKAIEKAGLDKVDRKYGVFPGSQDEELSKMTKEGRFKRWLNAVWRRDPTDMIAMKATLVEGSGSGSYVVPVEYANEIARVAAQYGVARRYCRNITLGTKSILIPDETGSVTVSVAGENTAFSETQPTLVQKTLTLKVAGAISPMSNELLRDTNVNLLGYFAEIYGEALALFEDDNTFGDATSFGTPLLSLTSGVDVNGSGASIANFTADDLQGLRRAVNPKYWPQAKFFAHPYVISYLEQIKNSAGDYIVRQPVESSAIRSLWGHELIPVDGMPSTDAASTAFVGFAVPTMCFFGTSGGMEVEVSREASLTTAGNLWEKNLSAIRVLESAGQVWSNEAGTARLLTSA